MGSEGAALSALQGLTASLLAGPVTPTLAAAAANAVSFVLSSPYGAAPGVLTAAGGAAGALSNGLALHVGGACATGGGGGGSASVSSTSVAVAIACAGSALSAPGSAASAAPLPAGIPGAGSAVAQFTALTFDPNLGTTAANSSGVVTMSLGDATSGAALPVSGLSQLIQLTVPSARLANGLLAAPAFWNATAQAYSSAGLTWLPNPAPPASALTVAWVPGFVATSDATLPLAWNISGSAAAGCIDSWLDCGNATQRLVTVNTCPCEAAAQLWSCGTATSGVIRVWTGCACALWRVPPNAPAPACGWNVSTQAFQGGGCVLANVTQVGTRHLTAFTVQASPPQIRTLSAKDLVSISPKDLVHIKLLLIIVCVLFAGMHLISALLARLDRRDFARLSGLAFSPSVGHTALQLPCPGGNGKDATAELWAWRFTQEALVVGEEGKGLVSGTAVVFAGLIGVPFARLACAVPSTMFGGRPAKHCVGRPEGLSPSRIEALNSRRLSRRLSQRSARLSTPHADGGLPTAGNTMHIGQLVLAEAEDAGLQASLAALSAGDVDLDTDTGVDKGVVDLLTVASTAFMHALLASWCIRGSDEIVGQQRLFLTHHYRGLPDAEARCHHFLRLYAVFKEMLIGGSVRAASNWMPKARMWRTILLSNQQGYWDADEHIAFALLANNQQYPPSKLQGFQIVMSLLSGVGSALVSTFVTGSSAGDAQNAAIAGQLVANTRRLLLSRRNKKAPAAGTAQPPSEEAAAKEAEAPAGGEAVVEKKHGRGAWYDLEGDDLAFTLEDGDDTVAVAGVTDPLSFTTAAILETIPPELVEALQPRGDSGDGDAALAARIWTTALVAAYLQSTEMFSWRVSPCTVPLAEQRTLLDVTLAWLTAQLTEAAGDSARDELLLRRLLLRAQTQSTRWAKLHDRRVTASRGAHVPTAEHGRMQGYSAAANVYVSLVNGHPTVSLFTSELSIGFCRWMGMNVLVSAIMCVLVVSIWFYWSKGAVCCDAARALLGCTLGDPLGECLGFAGTCGDLVTQPQAVAAFALLPDGQYISGGSFVCTAFPADGNARDTFLSGLISFAVSFPVAIVISNCFGLCTSTDTEQLHGRTRWLSWPFKYRLLLGPLSWRWSPDGKQPPPGRIQRLKRFLASWWCTNIYVDVMVWCADILRPCFCAPPPPRDAVSAAEDPHAALVDAAMLAWGADEGLESHFGALCTNFKRSGYVLLHLVWGVFAWMVFAYGRLVYNLLGPAATNSFSNSWGIGVALGQASDAQGVVTSALQAALLLTILEALWLMPNGRWMESYIDFISVQASVAQRGVRRKLAIMSAYKLHSYAIS